MDTYKKSITAGSTKLNAGDTKGALEVFQAALKELGAKPTSEVLQLIGVCQRMLGDAELATEAFSRAYAVATNDIDKGRIMRDWSMVPLIQGRYDDARKCLDEALGLLLESSVVEHAVTLGFVGRLEARLGNTWSAVTNFRRADMILKHEKTPPIYILNNLVHWMEVASLRERVKLARRAIPLAIRHDNIKRLGQIVLLVACRPLAIRLARR